MRDTRFAVNSVYQDMPCQLPDDACTVLLVEDEEFVRNITQEVLEMSGFKVFPARDAVEAVELCQVEGRRIDVLLTDVVMPGISGCDLAAELSKHLPDLKSVFMSGYAENVVMKRSTIPRGSKFLQKPFTFDTLTEKIREALDQEMTDRVMPLAAEPANVAELR